jgi:hypothetical protein
MDEVLEEFAEACMFRRRRERFDASAFLVWSPADEAARQRELHRHLLATQPELVKKLRKRTYERVKADPARLDALREYNREAYRKRALNPAWREAHNRRRQELRRRKREAAP